MPCYDPPQHVRDASERQQYRHESDVAELLCEVMHMLEDAAKRMPVSISPKLAAWWEEHKERDAREAMGNRIRAEMDAERAAAIAALTPEQRAELVRTRVITQEEADARL